MYIYIYIYIYIRDIRACVYVIKTVPLSSVTVYKDDNERMHVCKIHMSMYNTHTYACM